MAVSTMRRPGSQDTEFSKMCKVLQHTPDNSAAYGSASAIKGSNCHRSRSRTDCNGVSDVRAQASSTERVIPAVRSSQPSWSQAKMYISNNNKMDVDSSRIIVEDYVYYCLEKSGHRWPNGQRDARPNEFQRAMRAMGDEFESRFRNSFDDMLNHLDINPNTGYQTFKTIVGEIFADGVNWGRIVALFGFGGKLAVRCVEQSTPQLVHSIIDWVSDYVDNNLQSWITDNKGWEGFLEFYQGDPENRKKDSWPSLKRLCGIAAAGLGILTLAGILSQKS